MVAKTLVSRDIEGGLELLQQLRGHMRISTAFWWFDPETERWRLLIATPVYDRSGPREAYRLIQEALGNVLAEKRPSLSDIAAVSPGDPTAQAIRKLLRTSREPSNVRVTRNVIDGVYIDDAHVYVSH